MRTETWEIASLGGGRPLQSLSHTGIPQREAAAVCADEDPLLQLCLFRRSLHAVAINEVSQRERSLTRLGFRVIYIAAPIALDDLDDTALKIYVAPCQAQDFGELSDRPAWSGF